MPSRKACDFEGKDRGDDSMCYRLSWTTRCVDSIMKILFEGKAADISCPVSNEFLCIVLDGDVFVCYVHSRRFVVWFFQASGSATGGI